MLLICLLIQRRVPESFDPTILAQHLLIFSNFIPFSSKMAPDMLLCPLFPFFSEMENLRFAGTFLNQLKRGLVLLLLPLSVSFNKNSAEFWSHRDFRQSKIVILFGAMCFMKTILATFVFFRLEFSVVYYCQLK